MGEGELGPMAVVDESDPSKFEDRCSRLLRGGYVLSSSSCGFVQSEAYDFCSSYQAVLVLPKHVPAPSAPKAWENDDVVGEGTGPIEINSVNRWAEDVLEGLRRKHRVGAAPAPAPRAVRRGETALAIGVALGRLAVAMERAAGQRSVKKAAPFVSATLRLHEKLKRMGPRPAPRPVRKGATAIALAEALARLAIREKTVMRAQWAQDTVTKKRGEERAGRMSRARGILRDRLRALGGGS